MYLDIICIIIFLKGELEMEQEKIGKFISQLRKEKNMTQMDLAEKLNVTDKAISKWENGRGMPEISIIKPLCEELSITINELFCGEKIVETEFSEKAGLRQRSQAPEPL